MKIGLIVSRHGPGGLWAFASDACTMLAAAEVNARGGVLGRQVELVLADAGPTEAAAEAAARDLVEIDEVDAVIGRHPSDALPPITRGLAGRVPYVYTSMYEGGEQAGNVLPIGGTVAELLGHAIPSLVALRRARRFFVIGNDYVWPRRAAVAAARIVAGHGGHIVGAHFQPFGEPDHGAAFAKIVRSSADVVLTFLLGEESIRFNRAFAAAGLAARVLRLALGIDETVLYGAGPNAHEGLFVGTTYVARSGDRRDDGFIERYRDAFGAAVPPATVFGRSCYDALHLLAGLNETARRPGCVTLLRHIDRLAPRAACRHALPSTWLGASGHVHLAEAQGLELKVLATS